MNGVINKIGLVNIRRFIHCSIAFYSIINQFIIFNKKYQFEKLRSTTHTASARFLPIIHYNLSDIGEGIAEVQIKEWHIKEGDQVAEFDNICDVQSDKASVTITSRYDGIIKKLHYDVDEIAKVGAPLVDIEVEKVGEKDIEASIPKETSIEERGKDVAKNENLNIEGSTSKPLTTPAVRRIAKQYEIDLREVVGTGPGGRIVKEDLLHITQKAPAVEKAPEREASKVEVRFEPLKDDTVIKIRGYTRAMVKTMTESLKIPTFGYCDEIVIDELEKLRAQLKKNEAQYGVKMTYMPLFVKALSLALDQFPVLNAVMDEKSEIITYKASHNISIAMDTPEGLVTPNIKNCEQRTVWEIAVELNRLKEAGKRMQISASDLNDGTFTLSNIGVIGGTYAVPLILPPQVAIGAVGKIEKIPRFDQLGNVQAVSLVKISWSADHRIVDGATIARFSNLMKLYLENPLSMLAAMR